MKTSAVINSIDGSFRPYYAQDITKTKDTIDALAFEEALDHQQACAFGKTIARPITSEQAGTLETLSSHIRHAFQTRHVTVYRGRMKALDEIRDYIKDFRRHLEALA